MNEPIGAPKQQRIPAGDMADALERMAHGKRFWLTDFSHGRRKRPDHEVTQKQQEFAVLQQAVHDYRALGAAPEERRR